MQQFGGALTDDNAFTAMQLHPRTGDTHLIHVFPTVLSAGAQLKLDGDGLFEGLCEGWRPSFRHGPKVEGLCTQLVEE